MMAFIDVRNTYDEEVSRRRERRGSKIAHEKNDALTLPGDARTPSGCKSGDIKRTIIKKTYIMMAFIDVSNTYI
jgi:hypothetical protein